MLSELMGGRIKLVLAVIIAVPLASVGYLLATRSEPRGSADGLEQLVLTGVDDQRSEAQDATAKSILRNAAIAMEAAYIDHQDFATAFQNVESIEPNISWTTGPSALTDVDTVAVTFTSTNLGYVLQTTSASGRTFTHSRDDEGNVVRSCGSGCTW